MPLALTVKYNGLHSRVYIWGQEDRPPLLLLHDGMYGADALTAWDQVAPILAEKYFVIAPDLLGFGQSDKVVFLDRSPYGRWNVSVCRSHRWSRSQAPADPGACLQGSPH